MNHGPVLSVAAGRCHPVAAGRVTVKHRCPDLAAFHSRIKAGTVLAMAKSVHMGLTAFSIREIKINMLKGRGNLFRMSAWSSD